jgi:hypothetical protein
MLALAHDPIQQAEKRLLALGFIDIDNGFYERHKDAKTVRLGGISEGLLLQPIHPISLEPLAPSYLIESDEQFEQALTLLGAGPIGQ